MPPPPTFKLEKSLPTGWRDANRANWDERVAVHLAAKSYSLERLRAGLGFRDSFVTTELGPIAGLRVLHLQCHFGRDTLALAQAGAEVVGLDFSAPAIEAARSLASELGLEQRARFVHCDLFDAPQAIPEPRSFDLVFATWGVLCWLPDIARWADVAASFVRPGGALYLADAHPAAYVFDDATPLPDGMPGFLVPYFPGETLVVDDTGDYADEAAHLKHSRTYQWIHPLGDIVSHLIRNGLRLAWLHDHDAVPWRMFKCLVEGADGYYRWPDRRWLPLGFSLRAERL